MFAGWLCWNFDDLAVDAGAVVGAILRHVIFTEIGDSNAIRKAQAGFCCTSSQVGC